MGGGEEGEGNPDPHAWELDAQVEDLVWTHVRRKGREDFGCWLGDTFRTGAEGF